MERMPNLFLVSSPFQLLSAVEAKNYFNDPVNHLVIFYSLSRRNNSQMNKLLRLTDWDHIIQSESTYSTKLLYIKQLLLLKIIQVRRPFYDKIFIGHFRSEIFTLFVRNLPHNEEYLLDDGTATIEIQNNLLRNYNEKHRPNYLWMRTALLKFLILKHKPLDKIHLFTCFDLEARSNQVIIKNDFSALKRLSPADIEKEADKIYFIGGDYVEKKYFSQRYYIETLKKIRKYYKNKQLIYIPHRGEDHINILKIGGLDGFVVERFDNIVEVEFVLRNVYPRTVASFTSTALYTLQIIFPHAQVESFYVPPMEINPIFQSKIEQHYNFYKKLLNIVYL